MVEVLKTVECFFSSVSEEGTVDGWKLNPGMG